MPKEDIQKMKGKMHTMEAFGFYTGAPVYKCLKKEYRDFLRGIRRENDYAYFVIVDEFSLLIKDNMVVGTVNGDKTVSLFPSPQKFLKEEDFVKGYQCGGLVGEDKADYAADMVDDMKEVENNALDGALYTAAHSLTIGGLDLDSIIKEFAVYT